MLPAGSQNLKPPCTGVGIWYAITIASPRGTAGLIHSFVWVWAAEWVYFTVEVIGVYALV